MRRTYLNFLAATPVGMLPSIEGISDLDAYKEMKQYRSSPMQKRLSQRLE